MSASVPSVTSLQGSLTDQQAELLALQGLLEGICSNPLDCASSLMELNFNWTKPNLAGVSGDDTNATDATAETILAFLPRRAKLVNAVYTVADGTTVTASNSNYATITLGTRPGLTGVTSTLALGTLITTLAANGGSGNWAEWTPVPLTSIAAFDSTHVVQAGGILTVAIAKASAGVVVPAGVLSVRVQYV